MKRILACILMLCMLATLCSCGKPNQIEGKGFDSPEAAITAYAEAMKTGDVDKILATFAVETYVENFDTEKYLDTIGMYSVYSVPLDSIDAYTQSLSLIQRQYDISRNLTYMYLSLGNVEDFTRPVSFHGDPYDDAGDLLDDLMVDDWMDMMAEMEIGDVLELKDLPIDENAEEFLKKNLRNREKYLGCDDFVTLAVEVEIDSEDYYLCVDLACYDGKWYNAVPYGMLASLMGAPATCGGLVPEP